MTDDEKKLEDALSRANNALSDAIALSRGYGIQPGLIKAATVVSNAYVWFVQNHA